MFNQFGLFSLFITLTCNCLYAQSFADFKRVQVESFSKFRDKKDSEFNKYLQAQWKEYNAYISPPMYQKPKPKVVPALSQKTPQNVGPNLVINIKPSVVKALTSPVKKLKGYDATFTFFGIFLGFDFDKGMKNAKFYPRRQKGIINFFSVMAASDYDNLLYNIKVTCKHMNLNDWGIYLLVDKLSHTLFSTPDDAKLFSWFIFNKLGYRVKVALGADKHVVLLHEIKGKMYSTPNYTFDGKKFYVISEYNKSNIGDIYTYSQDYPDATKALDFELKTLPILEKNLQTKTVSFREYGKVYSASYRYNQNLIDFMNSYPQVDYKVFFNAPLEYETYKDIAGDIKQYTDNKKASEALNFVLRFVQKAFKYERDNAQFGREKVMFAQETLCYDKSDCEDRAVLYARLVKDLFGISVVGVKYKDHMSTALHVPMRGDSVKVSGQRYVLADPTYVNASLGQSIPKYKSIIPDSFVYVK
ncbi:hypothetical protein [Sulfurimonas autotrophica]|uniref:hypothetical protein n=1 Tax=Sulfurimonas autotrophica TaxID=202747 RepID=UPI000308AF96|nr:hypothetical protein [Sulfurimonas autotrophica]